jgi:hypothetical protein
MGHATRNLALNPTLMALYAGAITSPVNDDPPGVGKICGELAPLETVFDPQAYNPRSERGQLPEWPYFAKFGPYETAVFDAGAWTGVITAMLADCIPLGHAAVCSPAVANDSTDDQLGDAVQAGDALADALVGTELSGLQTAFIRSSTLTGAGRPETVASILTNGRLRRTYIVPRWSSEALMLGDANEMLGFAKTLALVSPERDALVGYCGPEMILWKAAGAHSAATGKYDNQQRWSSKRWDPKKSGGSGTTAYYFETSLLAWLRTEDIVRLDALGYAIGLANDPFYPEIRRHIEALKIEPARMVPVLNRNGKALLNKNGKPRMRREGPPDWLRLGWLQWLWWFGFVERELDAGRLSSRALVEAARTNWRWLQARRFVATDAENDGSWLPSWRVVLDGLGV